jgi:nucleoside-diphosphate-sugar epimerase
MPKQVALVAGANGVVGRGIVEQLARAGEWEIVGLGRNEPESWPGHRFVAVDLRDAADSQAKRAGFAAATHLFYCAFLPAATEAEQQEINAAMFRNLLEAIEPVAAGLEHISLMEGAKAYGCHFGPCKTPAKETDPRHLPPNFYYAQEDILFDRRRGKRWTWSILRPDLVCGLSVGYPMNLLLAIAIYASICKELKLPFRFPGTTDAYGALFDATDAGLLARAAIWASTKPAGADQIFNVNNGDCFRWEHLWPRLADWFGLEVAPPIPIPLSAMMADKGPLWNAMTRTHGLIPIPFDRLVSWEFAQFVFRIGYDVISDATKLRRAGFSEMVETEAMFPRMFAQLRERRYIP